MPDLTERRICWPKPDATCLEGGCLYCNERPFKPVEDIRRWAMRAGAVMNRGNGTTTEAMKAFHYGLNTGWGNAEVRTREVARG